jgi:hypothetical protein
MLDHKCNEDITEEPGITNMSTTLRTKKWLEHLQRIPGDKIPI